MEDEEITTESLSPKRMRELQRIEELSVTFTGLSSCAPDPEIKWDKCVVRDKTLDEAPASIINGTGK